MVTNTEKKSLPDPETGRFLVVYKGMSLYCESEEAARWLEFAQKKFLEGETLQASYLFHQSLEREKAARLAIE